MAHYKLVLVLFLISISMRAGTLEVGPGKQYPRLQSASAAAKPGDTIAISAGVYSGGDAIVNLKGTADQWIVIRGLGEVIYRGSSQAFQMSDAEYVRIQSLIFESQTSNGVNIDDAGSLDSPSHHIIIEQCEWRALSASGNNDQLKLSGIDDFVVRNCTFRNGSAGGSCIDMVGCHRGVFVDDRFENGGSNCIQAKGGSQFITIQQCRFINGGERALNIGGSTGAAFFRPQNAGFEAADISVRACVFRGSQAPIAFVGAVRCSVYHCTIIQPDRWAVRILQENTTAAMAACANNFFANNIVAFSSTQPTFNIGPNTKSETFVVSHNLWYHVSNTNWSGPNSPVNEPGRILNRNPQFADTLYHLSDNSPAARAGLYIDSSREDYFHKSFANPPSIGAVELSKNEINLCDSVVVDSVYYSDEAKQIVVRLRNRSLKSWAYPQVFVQSSDTTYVVPSSQANVGSLLDSRTSASGGLCDVFIRCTRMSPINEIPKSTRLTLRIRIAVSDDGLHFDTCSTQAQFELGLLSSVNDDDELATVVYPQPLRDNILHIRSSESSTYSLDLLESCGRICLHQSNTSSLDCSGLANGCYTLVVSNAKQRQAYRVVIAR